MRLTPRSSVRVLTFCCFLPSYLLTAHAQPRVKDARRSIELAYRKADRAMATHDVEGCLSIVPWNQIGTPLAQQQMKTKMTEQLKLMFASELVLHQVTEIEAFALKGNRASVRVHRHTTAANAAHVPIGVSNPDRNSQDEWMLAPSGWKPLRSVVVHESKSSKTYVQSKNGP